MKNVLLAILLAVVVLLCFFGVVWVFTFGYFMLADLILSYTGSIEIAAVAPMFLVMFPLITLGIWSILSGK
jgi:hypothetical protein